MSGDLQSVKVDLASIPDGFYDGISNAEYHSAPGISKSGLDLIAQSPLHYWDKYLNPDKPERSESDALKIGSACHSLVFEPHLFANEYVQAPEGINRRTKDGKAEWEAFLQANAGKVVLDADDWQHVHKLAAAVRAHPAAGHLLAMPGHAERSVFYHHPEYEVLVKCRADWWIDLPDGRILIVDLKTTTDAKPGEFERHAWDYRYHVAAAWYTDIIAAVTGREVAGFVFIAAEKSRPYALCVRPADDVFLEEGRKEYRANLDLYARCKKSGQWPAYSDHLLPMGPPRWVLESISKKWR